LYFIAVDSFEKFKNILRSLFPLAGLGVIMMIRLKFWRERGKKVEREGGGDEELLITYMDKLKMDLFIFSLPAAVCLVFFTFEGTISAAAIFAATVVFIIAYLFEKWLLRKARG
jgi:uncharacterized membrane protein YqjE